MYFVPPARTSDDVSYSDRMLTLTSSPPLEGTRLAVRFVRKHRNRNNNY